MLSTRVRFVSRDASGAVEAKYVDTLAYQPSACDDDTLAACMPAPAFYAAMLDAHFERERRWREEGRMALSLPPGGATDGPSLALQALRCLALDMATRAPGGVWPRYGTSPGYEQPSVGANGFQEIFTSSMMASLEWGLFGYARAVLRNWVRRQRGGMAAAAW